ncbi:MAG: tRNA epoxyqueuosine(34) reductase QueG [Rhodothermales bacterium]|nr:tRNA epoxyqueuosine(34) reductase QueG [Rhodothermales bacterium]
MPEKAPHTEAFARELKREARRLGFDGCGISKVERLDAEARRLEQWLSEERHASMQWMANNFEKRVDPGRLVDGARSVVSVIHNYYQEVDLPEDPASGRISRYALGDDYHNVVKDRLRDLYSWLDERVPDLQGRAFVDSAPVMDKVWAQRSGLGWIGKHTNLINRDLGSYFFVGELITTAELATDGPIPDYCGSCTRCIDACPTDAIYRPYAVDANRCISYLTIEHREDDIAPDLAASHGNWIFGCDICQDVCPWNKFVRRTTESRYLARDGLVGTHLSEWMELDLGGFREAFRANPVKRTRFDGFRRNVRIALQNYAANQPSPPAAGK